MEDNHYVIMDRYPSNQLIARIQMTSNKMFPLTLKPSMKRKTMQVVGKERDAQSKIEFKAERKKVSSHSSKEGKGSVCSFKEK